MIEPNEYKLLFEDRPGYLYARVEGDHDGFEVTRSYWQEIARNAADRRATRVLIDEHIAAEPTINEIQEIALKIATMFYSDTRVAFIDGCEQHIRVNALGMMVAVSRGLNVRMFNDVASAESWLLDIGR